MSIPIYVDSYSGYKANERPLRFELDGRGYEITDVEDRWQDPNAEYFKVRTTDGKHYLLRYEEHTDEWTLQSGFDGKELFERPGIELIPVDGNAIKEAIARIAGCEHCRRDEAELLFDWVLADVLGRDGPFEFFLTETAYCPNCHRPITEKTLIESQGGVEVDSMA
jgi:hypothetical protein